MSRVNVLHRITRIAGYAALIVAIGSIVYFWGHTQAQSWHHSRVRELSNLYGAGAMAAGFAAVAVWVSRKVYIEVKKRKIPDFELTRATLLYLRKHHMLLGWITLAVAAAHGVYYLLLWPFRWFEVITGVVALGILALLVPIGLRLNAKIKAKQKSKRNHALHFTIAIVFIIAMVVHAAS